MKETKIKIWKQSIMRRDMSLIDVESKNSKKIISVCSLFVYRTLAILGFARF